jgi:hypothetical protein
MFSQESVHSCFLTLHEGGYLHDKEAYQHRILPELIISFIFLFQTTSCDEPGVLERIYAS